MFCSSKSNGNNQNSSNMPTARSNKGDPEIRFTQREASTSEHSISSIVSSISITQDENFRVTNHAENSLKVMESYFQNQQLTDVTLVAGKGISNKENNNKKKKKENKLLIHLQAINVSRLIGSF